MKCFPGTLVTPPLRDRLFTASTGFGFRGRGVVSLFFGTSSQRVGVGASEAGVVAE